MYWENKKAFKFWPEWKTIDFDNSFNLKQQHQRCTHIDGTYTGWCSVHVVKIWMKKVRFRKKIYVYCIYSDDCCRCKQMTSTDRATCFTPHLSIIVWVAYNTGIINKLVKHLLLFFIQVYQEIMFLKNVQEKLRMFFYGF